MLAIRNMIAPDEEDDFDPTQTSGSMFGPGNIGGGRDESKPLAPANAKVEAKVNRDNLPTPEEEEQQKEKAKAEKAKKKVDSKNSIWAEEEIKEIVLPKKDDRLQPEFDIKFK